MLLPITPLTVPSQPTNSQNRPIVKISGFKMRLDLIFSICYFASKIYSFEFLTPIKDISFPEPFGIDKTGSIDVSNSTDFLHISMKFGRIYRCRTEHSNLW